MRYLISILAMLAVYSCGDMQKEKTCQEDVTKCPKVEAIKAEQYFYLNGSVVGAFEIEVDGQPYADIETFYSEENAKLNQKVIQAGYKGYTAQLDGKLGFRDLTNGMAVFVAPNDRRGYAAKTVVSSNDTFSLRFPEAAAHDVYKVKATKRINVKLTKPIKKNDDKDSSVSLADTAETEVKLLCYNFSAIDVAVSYEEVNKPVILSSFETKLTDYACEDVKPSETLQIPSAE